MPFDALLDFFHEVVHLMAGGTHFNGRIEQTGRTYHLFGHNTFRAFQLVFCRSGGNVNGLGRQCLEFFEAERAVVFGRRQTETVFDQIGLSGQIAAVHRPYLRHGDVTFVDDEQKILREEVQEAVGTRARRSAVEVAAVVFDAGTVAEFAYHLDVVVDALLQTLCLKVFADALEISHLFLEVFLDEGNGGFLLVGRRDEEVGRIDAVVGKRGHCVQGLAVQFLQTLYFVAPEGHSEDTFAVGQKDVHGVAFDPDAASCRRDVVAHVERVEQTAQQGVVGDGLSDGQIDDVVVKGCGIAHAIDATHRRDYYDVVAPGEQCAGGGEAQAVDLFVDGQIFLDVGVGGGDVGLGLIIVVVGDVVFHCVLGKELFHLAVELSCEGFVVRKNEGGAAEVLDDIGHRERLAAAGDAEQRLCRQSLTQTFRELSDGFRLIARRLVS